MRGWQRPTWIMARACSSYECYPMSNGRANKTYSRATTITKHHARNDDIYGRDMVKQYQTYKYDQESQPSGSIAFGASWWIPEKCRGLPCWTQGFQAALKPPAATSHISSKGLAPCHPNPARCTRAMSCSGSGTHQEISLGAQESPRVLKTGKYNNLSQQSFACRQPVWLYCPYSSHQPFLRINKQCLLLFCSSRQGWLFIWWYDKPCLTINHSQMDQKMSEVSDVSEVSFKSLLATLNHSVHHRRSQR